MNGTQQPFMRHEFLHALESSGSICPATGWEPAHLFDGSSAIPLFRKHHSWGEFVFDWAWADACQRAGLRYYPKLVTAAPVSPVTGARLLGENAVSLIDTGKDLAERENILSWHVLFPTAEELPAWRDAGFLVRMDTQFHWQNRGYGDFDGFLAALTSKRRKEIRRERRQVRDAGIRFRILSGADLDEQTHDAIYRCYANTYHLRGRMPYLTPAFFRTFAAALPDSLVIFLAEHAGRPIAAAICLRDEQALYGRYWGALEDVPGLHFEACYYQGIDYCLRAGLDRFEPGTQGEHKIPRGFEPVPVHSAHWFRHDGLHAAVADFLQRETPMVKAYMREAAQLLPFRKDGTS